MRGTTALAALLLGAAAVDAQEYVWNADRPDGVRRWGSPANAPYPGPRSS